MSEKKVPGGAGITGVGSGSSSKRLYFVDESGYIREACNDGHGWRFPSSVLTSAKSRVGRDGPLEAVAREGQSVSIFFREPGLNEISELAWDGSWAVTRVTF